MMEVVVNLEGALNSLLGLLLSSTSYGILLSLSF